ncbi:MAG: hypothetical protein CL666_03775 [Balneola sp.]|nr:hypothetical protein [Balneola sp.]|tara:strand:- start:90566 stop:91333 length:768 start_codon:yes stop_codon:yes gene_type:complete
METLKEKSNSDLVLDLIYTSESNKSQIINHVTIQDAAIIISNEDGTWYSYLREYKEAFDGIKETEASNSNFGKRLEAVSNLIFTIENRTRSKLGSIRKKEAELKEGYEVELEQSDDKQINKLIEQVADQQGRILKETIIVDEIPKQLVAVTIKNLDDLANVMAKERVMKEAFEVAISKGQYDALEEFQSVPNACREFVKKNEREFNLTDKSHIDELKHWIFTSVLIYEDDTPFYDKKVINDRINAWKSKELKGQR